MDTRLIIAAIYTAAIILMIFLSGDFMKYYQDSPCVREVNGTCVCRSSNATFVNFTHFTLVYDDGGLRCSW